MKKTKNIKNKLLILFVLIVISLIMPLLYAASISDEVSSTLIIRGKIHCENGGYRWIDARANQIQYYETTGDSGSCYSPDPDNTLSTLTCCPGTQECIPDEEGGVTSSGAPLFKCKSTSKDYCWDFNAEDECNLAASGIIDESARFLSLTCGIDEESYDFNPDETICWDEIVCRCKWNSVNNNCTFFQEKNNQCTESPLEPDPQGTCEWNLVSVDDLCNTEEKVQIFHFTGVKDTPYAVIDCPKIREVTVPCGEIVQLDFFGLVNMIISVFALIIIYFFILKKGKIMK